MCGDIETHIFPISSFRSKMNCVPSSKCAFAADRLLLLTATTAQYEKLRAATVAAGRTGTLEIRFVAEDVALLDKKIMETTVKMRMLAPCLRS